MKTLKFNHVLSLLFIATATLFTSCVGEDDYADITFSAVEPEIDGNVVELSTIYEDLQQNDLDIVTFEESNDGQSTYAVGYVVSSDIGGNFYKELVIQDRPENPTFGVSIQVNKAPLFTLFEVGQKVYIKLDGLSALQEFENDNEPDEEDFDISDGEFGVVELGINDGGQIGQIGQSFFSDHIIRSSEVAEIVPTSVELGSITPDMLNTYVTFENVQFLRELMEFQLDEDGNETDEIISSISFAGEATDEFDGERTLESCVSNGQIILSTSTFSDFKSASIPQGSGQISGVLTRTFEGDKYTFYLNSQADASEMNGERCDPIIYSCGTVEQAAANELINLDFEGEGTGPVNVAGWTNYIEAGSVTWETYSAGGSNASLGTSARIGSFQSGDDSSVAWLISPEIDIESNTKVTLEFKTSNSFSDDSNLQLLYSTNWDGTEAGIATADWGIISDATIVGDDIHFSNWVGSNVVDMSCFEANGHFAFKYIGSGSTGADGTYELDEIMVNVE